MIESLNSYDQNIIILVCEGFVAKEIAAKLNRSPAHVERRIKGLRAKYNARNTPHLIHILFELSKSAENGASIY